MTGCLLASRTVIINLVVTLLFNGWRNAAKPLNVLPSLKKEGHYFGPQEIILKMLRKCFIGILCFIIEAPV